MRIEQLEYVTAVTRLGSFRRAAEELHISQPALSETVRNLERELGVDVLERRRSGTTISDAGRELLPDMLRVLDAVNQLRRTAGHRRRSSRVVRLGSVHAATVPIVLPAVRDFVGLHPATGLEVVTAPHADVDRGLEDGSLDLGLVNLLPGDDVPPSLEATPVTRSPAVVVMHPDSPLAARATVTPADLLTEPLITMRPGYAMHRLIHRLLGDQAPSSGPAADGAEMGKLLVAERLGITVLPAHSVDGDPLQRLGAITSRPLVGDAPEIVLALEQRRGRTVPEPTTTLRRLILAGATTDQAATAAAGDENRLAGRATP